MLPDKINMLPQELNEFHFNSPEKIFPKIVCLCGSSKFKEEFDYAAAVFTYHGWIVLSMCFFSHHERVKSHPLLARFDSIKPKLDELHKRKIDLADLVFFMNVGNYIGQSTKSELDYSIEHKKPIAFWASSEVNLVKLELK